MRPDTTHLQIHSNVSRVHFARKLHRVVTVIEAVAVNANVLLLLLLDDLFGVTLSSVTSGGVTRVADDNRDAKYDALQLKQFPSHFHFV